MAASSSSDHRELSSSPCSGRVSSVVSTTGIKREITDGDDKRDENSRPLKIAKAKAMPKVTVLTADDTSGSSQGSDDDTAKTRYLKKQVRRQDRLISDMEEERTSLIDDLLETTAKLQIAQATLTQAEADRDWAYEEIKVLTDEINSCLNRNGWQDLP